MKCPRCGDDDIHGPACSCGVGPSVDFGPARPTTTVEPTHSNMPRDDAILEARRLGNPSPGDGWRRLLWRLADLLESRDNTP